MSETAIDRHQPPPPHQQQQQYSSLAPIYLFQFYTYFEARRLIGMSSNMTTRTDAPTSFSCNRNCHARFRVQARRPLSPRPGPPPPCYVRPRVTLTLRRSTRHPQDDAQVKIEARGALWDLAISDAYQVTLTLMAHVQGSTDRSPQSTDGTASATRTIRPDAFARIRTTCTPAYSAPCRESLLART